MLLHGCLSPVLRIAERAFPITALKAYVNAKMEINSPIQRVSSIPSILGDWLDKFKKFCGF